MQKITKPTKQNNIVRGWHIVDVKSEILGKASTKIATLLLGKSKPYFAKNLDCGDHVVVVNASEVRVTGKKADNKIYMRYSGYSGGLKKETFTQLKNRRPEEIIRHAVKGMLPDNRLKAPMLKRLYVFAGAEHKYEEQLKAQSSKVKGSN